MGQLSTANLVFGTKHNGGSRKTRSNKGVKRGPELEKLVQEEDLDQLQKE